MRLLHSERQALISGGKALQKPAGPPPHAPVHGLRERCRPFDPPAGSLQGTMRSLRMISVDFDGVFIFAWHVCVRISGVNLSQLHFTACQVLDSDGSGGLSSLEFQAAMKKLVLMPRVSRPLLSAASVMQSLAPSSRPLVSFSPIYRLLLRAAWLSATRVLLSDDYIGSELESPDALYRNALRGLRPFRPVVSLSILGRLFRQKQLFVFYWPELGVCSVSSLTGNLSLGGCLLCGWIILPVSQLSFSASES